MLIDRFSTRYGWRGVWLILLGAMWVLFGVGVLQDPAVTKSWVLYENVPVVIQAAFWWLSGAIAIWQGLRGKNHDDSWGHVALYFMPATRVVSFTVAWAIYLGALMSRELGLTHDLIGYSKGWYAALIWSLVSMMLGVAASWPNPAPPIPKPPVDSGVGVA